MTSRLYESMFLLDNTAVRESWQSAKEAVTATIEKHGGSVHTARHWGEKRLAYPIARRHRATYLLSYIELPTDALPAMRRELELSERVIRYLITLTDEVPDAERELTAKESSGEVVIPEPPADDAPEREPRAETSEDEDDGRDRRARRRPPEKDSDSAPDSAGSDDAETSDEAKED